MKEKSIIEKIMKVKIMKDKMNENSNADSENDLQDLCKVVKKYIREQNFEECTRIIPKYMELYPNSAIPHNLLGIVLEMQGKHTDAMKHFRAAVALDTTYVPAMENLNAYGEFSYEKRPAPAYSMEDSTRCRERVCMGF